MRDTKVGRLADLLMVDRAVIAGVAARVLQLGAAPVTLLVITRFFSAEVQGFHYTFASLIALQSFAELGFSIVIVNVASHEWAHLGLDAQGGIVGNQSALSRLASLGRLTSRWYGAASVLFVIIVAPFGLWFFTGHTDPAIQWRLPWLVLVALAGCQLWMLSFTSILEGCNQIGTVYRFRLAQVVASNVVFWAVAILHGALWASVALAAARLSVDVALVAIRYRRFFTAFRRTDSGGTIHWFSEIWPMQWRLAVSGMTNYLAFSLFTPVMFRYYGPIVAGQMGMTQQALGGIQAIAIVWLNSRIPSFGALIAQRNRVGFEALWRRTSAISLAIYALGAISLSIFVYFVERSGLRVSERILPLTPTAILLTQTLLVQIALCMTAYMRAHRQEPIMVMSVVTNVMMGVAVWESGRRFGPLGVACATLGVAVVLLVWESRIWQNFRAAASDPRSC